MISFVINRDFLFNPQRVDQFLNFFATQELINDGINKCVHIVRIYEGSKPSTGFSYDDWCRSHMPGSASRAEIRARVSRL